jgi:hypothetical protein
MSSQSSTPYFEASFSSLITALATQTLIALGLGRDPLVENSSEETSSQGNSFEGPSSKGNSSQGNSSHSHSLQTQAQTQTQTQAQSRVQAQTQTQNLDLPLAKFNIDLLLILQEKTEGRLNSEEKQLLQHLLQSLQSQYLLIQEKK